MPASPSCSPLQRICQSPAGQRKVRLSKERIHNGRNTQHRVTTAINRALCIQHICYSTSESNTEWMMFIGWASKTDKCPISELMKKISLLLNTKWINNLLTVTLLAGACMQYVACLFKEPVFSVFDEISFLLLYSAKICLILHINSKCLFQRLFTFKSFQDHDKCTISLRCWWHDFYFGGRHHSRDLDNSQ